MSSGKSNEHASAATEAPDLSGRVIYKDYRLLRLLGQGGMGQVYLAEQLSLKRNVAVKILRPDLAASPNSLARFKKEAQAVAKVNHANIVQVYHFGVEDGLAYMVLEYVEGKNLKQILTKKGPPELPITLRIMQQVAAALHRAHEMGIIHRDVKPENILVTRKTEVKVADFGLVRLLEADKPALNLTQTGVTMGTPLYMSPEQVEGKPVDCRSDVYSFGVTCYQLLSGQPPFAGETAFEVALQHVQKQPVPLSKIRPDLPEGLCAIVHKMMAKKPSDRYQTCKELLRDVSRLRDTTPGANRNIQRPPSSGEQPAVESATPASAQTTTMPAAFQKRSGLLVAAVVLSILVAAASGGAFAVVDYFQSGPLPHGKKLPVADASVNEDVTLPSKEEQRLREVVESYLNPKGKTADPAVGVGLAMELGLTYLESQRFKEADALFSRLETYKDGQQASHAYRQVGQFGKGIVLALNDQHKESNRRFREVFGNSVEPKGGLKQQENKLKQVESKLSPSIVGVKQNPNWRYWVARARWYNSKNGLSESEVPYWMKVYFPLSGPDKQGDKDKRPPKPPDKDKRPPKDREKGG